VTPAKNGRKQGLANAAGTEKQGVSPMKTESKIGRRDVLLALGAGAGVAVAASGPLVQEAAADRASTNEKRKARYQENSPDVQAFYRVNRYPTK
jgi:hypothetical protein